MDFDDAVFDDALMTTVVPIMRATVKIGGSHVQRLRWLLELVQLAPESLEADDLCFEVLGFIFGGKRSIQFKDLESFRPAKLIPSLKVLERSLRQLAETGQWKLPITHPFIINRNFKAPKNKTATGFAAATYFESDDAATRFLLSADEVVGIEGSRIRVCALEECDRLFVRRTHGQFCRKQHALRDHKRRFRAGKGNVEVNSKQREYYRKKTKSAAKKRKGAKMKNRRGQQAENI